MDEPANRKSTNTTRDAEQQIRMNPPVIKDPAKRGEAARAALASGPRVTIDFDFVRDVRGKRSR